MLSQDLMEIIRCPKCLGALTEVTVASGEGLRCPACHLFYPILDGIPNMLLDEARPEESPRSP